MLQRVQSPVITSVELRVMITYRGWSNDEWGESDVIKSQYLPEEDFYRNVEDLIDDLLWSVPESAHETVRIHYVDGSGVIREDYLLTER